MTGWQQQEVTWQDNGDSRRDGHITQDNVRVVGTVMPQYNSETVTARQRWYPQSVDSVDGTTEAKSHKVWKDQKHIWVNHGNSQTWEIIMWIN